MSFSLEANNYMHINGQYYIPPLSDMKHKLVSHVICEQQK